MKVLFLDDNRLRQSAARGVWAMCDLIITDTVHDTIRALRNGRFDYVSLDHDLDGKAFVDSDRDDCGMEIVRWLMNERQEIGIINVHSWNVVGADKMVDGLREAGYNVERRLFGDGGFVDQQ